MVFRNHKNCLSFCIFTHNVLNALLNAICSNFTKIAVGEIHLSSSTCA